MYEKHYDPNGKSKFIISINEKKRIKEFTGGRDISEFEIINEPKIGKACVIPCTTNYRICREDEYECS